MKHREIMDRRRERGLFRKQQMLTPSLPHYCWRLWCILWGTDRGTEGTALNSSLTECLAVNMYLGVIWKDTDPALEILSTVDTWCTYRFSVHINVSQRTETYLNPLSDKGAVTTIAIIIIDDLFGRVIWHSLL